MDRSLGMDNERMGRSPLERRRMIIRSMPDFKSNLSGLKFHGQKMEIVHREVRLIGCLRVIPMRHIKNITVNILLDHKPRPTREPHTLALTNGMEPQTTMLTNTLTRLQFNDIPWILTQITSDIIIIVDLP